MIIRTLVFFSIVVLLESCDPGYGVILRNKTDKDLKVKVFSESFNHLNFLDSILISDTNTLDFLPENISGKFSVRTDSIDGSFNFIINKYQSAMFEFGTGLPDKNQSIVLNDIDTLKFENESRLTRDGTFMSKKFVFTIE